MGNVFYDPDTEEHYRVLNIVVYRGKIVAGYARWNPTKDEQDDSEVGQMHVANVEQLLCPMEKDASEILKCTSEAISVNESPFDSGKTGRDQFPEECYLLSDGKEIAGTLAKTYGIKQREINIDERSRHTPAPIREDFDPNFLQQEPSRSIDSMIDLPVSSDPSAQLCYALATTFTNQCSSTEEPNTYRQAMEGPYHKEWLSAVADELESLRVRGVLNLIPFSRKNSSGRSIGTRFIFKIKMKHGRVDKFKCRLVARGFMLRPNIDYADAFSPVARTNSLRLFVKLSVDRGHTRTSIDFKTAYLNAPINETIYLLPTEGMDCPPGHVYQLGKALYGIPQAGRSWNSILTELLTTKGLKQCVSDPCLFVADAGNLMVIVYVDDVIISSLHQETGQTLIKELEEVFEIGEKGPVDWYLGISFDDRGNYVRMSQKDYVDKMLTKYAVDLSRTEDTPMNDKIKLIKNDQDELDLTFDIKGKVGSLMYLAVCTRPDISYAVSVIARMSNHPSRTVCNAINHLFAYLNKNKDLGIVFIQEENTEEEGYCDSDYAGDENDFKSTSGIAIFLGLTIICWYVSKQTTTAQSSSDAEAIAMNFASKEVVWIRGILRELGEEIKLPTKMHGDNQAAIQLSNNPVFHKRTKHIMVKISYMQEQVKEGIIIWHYIASLLNIADMFTKALCRLRFLEARDRLRLEGPRTL